MRGFSKKRFSLHKTISVVVVVLYIFLNSTIELLHNEEQQSIPSNTERSVPVTEDNECPACKFLAGHSSIKIDFSLTFINTECLFVSQFFHPVTVPHNYEWYSSIISRAPPSSNIS